jgi:hypothetical protein
MSRAILATACSFGLIIHWIHSRLIERPFATSRRTPPRWGCHGWGGWRWSHRRRPRAEAANLGLPYGPAPATQYLDAPWDKSKLRGDEREVSPVPARDRLATFVQCGQPRRGRARPGITKAAYHLTPTLQPISRRNRSVESDETSDGGTWRQRGWRR